MLPGKVERNYSIKKAVMSEEEKARRKIKERGKLQSIIYHWWAEPPWGHLGHVPGLHAATCRSSGGSAVVPAPKNVVCPEDDEQIRHRSVFPGTPLDPVFGPGNLFFLNFRKLGHESCCHRIWKSFQSKRAKRKKELQNPASLLGRKSQKAKRFGLRMVEGDIFRSERRSSK